MAALPGEPVGVVNGPYFTKYSEDHWTTAETPAQSAVMFKDREYPSASAALEAYIQQHEKRPGRGLVLPGCTPIRAVEPVEELLVPQVSGHQLQAQRLRALRNMVDEAYDRLASRGQHQGATLTGSKENADFVNNTLTESQRLLTQITTDHLTPPQGPTPSASTGSMATDVLLNVKPLNYASSGIPSNTNTKRSSFKTMQDYVEEARRAGITQGSFSGSALSQLQASLTEMRSRSEHARPIVDTESLGGVIGSTAKPTILSVPASSRVYGSGGRRPPSWIEDLGTTPLRSTNGQQNGVPKVKSVTYADDLSRSNGHLAVQDLRASHSERLQSNMSKDDIYLLQEGVAGQKPGSAYSDFVSLTTDDLVYASPDGRSLSGMKLAHSLSSPGAGNPKVTQNNGVLNQQPSPTTQRIGREALLSSRTANGESGSSQLLSSMRRDFAARLLQEVEEGHSSIITGHLGEGRALNPYESPILPHRAPAAQVPSPLHSAPSPTRLRTLGLLTPETERLLSNPPMPGPMPGYAPSPVLPHFSSESSESPKSDNDETPTIDHQNDTEDFTERVRALLLAPPTGGETNTSPGGVSDTQQTDDILDGDREWERQPPYKPLKYVTEELSYGPRLDTSGDKRANIVDSFLMDCLDETDKEKSGRLTGPAQPGSMEALKNMLFKVQGMVPPPSDLSLKQEAETSSGDEENQEEVEPSGGEGEKQEDGEDVEVRCEDGTSRPTPTTQDGTSRPTPTTLSGLGESCVEAAFQDPDNQEVEMPLTASQKSLTAYQHLVSTSDSFDDQQGTESLQKAMEHLSRLKTLVKETK